MTLSVADFEYVRRLVHTESAVTLGQDRQYLVETRLAPLAVDENLGSVPDLVERLRSGHPALRRMAVEAMLTNETLFFRDVHPFDALRNAIIPAVLAANGGRQLSMWSAAASTGQEAYSLALLLREHFATLNKATILATDISERAMDRGRRGRFSHMEVNRGLPATLLVKHFDRVGRDWQLHDDVRCLVRWRQINLATPLLGIPPMDVVLLRNLLLYFDAPTRVTVVNALAHVMRPGGYLLLGGTEINPPTHPRFERVSIGRSVFYRLLDPKEGTSARARS